jgi:hypothetical protein
MVQTISPLTKKTDVLPRKSHILFQKKSAFFRDRPQIKKIKTSSMYEKKCRYWCLTVQWKLLLMILDGLAEENDRRFNDLRALKPSLPVGKIPFS